MSFLDDFDNALELEFEELAIGASDRLGLNLASILNIVDTALDDLKHQRIVDTNKVTNWLLDIRNLANRING